MSTQPFSPASAPQEEWSNIAHILLNRRRDMQELLTDDELRIRIQFFAIYLILGFVSFGMTLVNIITGWHLLMLSTLIFAIANVINAAISLIGPKFERAARYLFALEIMTLFTFFVIVGEPEGFSAIWAALLPSAGLLLFRMGYGSLLSTTQLAILIFLLWTEPGQGLLLYEYTDSFMLRFPMLYTAFFMVGFFFEFLRYNTQKELSATRSKFEYLYNHDALTGLYNRYGFNLLVDQWLAREEQDGFAFAILDLDHFKQVNDTYGHQNGDAVLRQTAKNLSEILGAQGVVCRWGGEEFSILFQTMDSARALCETILRSCRDTNYTTPSGCSFRVTTSIGLVLIPPGAAPTASEIVTRSDANLYEAKEAGRDRLTVSTF